MIDPNNSWLLPLVIIGAVLFVFALVIAGDRRP